MEGDFFMTEAMHMITFTGAPGAADQAAAPADHGAAGGRPSGGARGGPSGSARSWPKRRRPRPPAAPAAVAPAAARADQGSPGLLRRLASNGGAFRPGPGAGLHQEVAALLVDIKARPCDFSLGRGRCDGAVGRHPRRKAPQ